MSAEVTSHVFALERSTFFINLSFCSNNDARNTKTTLQTAAGSKRICKCITLDLADTFECCDIRVGNLVDRLLTTDDRFSIDKHGAAPALSARRTTIFWRSDIEFFAQCGQKMWMISANRDWGSVDNESDSVRRVSLKGSAWWVCCLDSHIFTIPVLGIRFTDCKNSCYSIIEPR